MKMKLKSMVGCLMAGVIALGMCQTAFAAGTGEFDPPGNLLENPGMEESPVQTQWIYDDNTGFIDGATNESYGLFAPHSGKYCVGFLPNDDLNKPAVIYQEVEIPEDGMYEFSGYFASGADTLGIVVGDYTVTFPGNDRVWERQSILFYASAGETVTITIASIHHQEPTGSIQIGVGFWLDDVCLTRCIGTSFEEQERDQGNYWDFYDADSYYDFDFAKEGETCLEYYGGNNLNITIDTEMEPGEYMVSFYAKSPEGYAQPTIFDVYDMASGESGRTVEIELTDQWKYVTLEAPIVNYEFTTPNFTIYNEEIPIIYIDNFAVTKVGDAPSVEKLSNGGFESNLSSWNEVGNSVAFTTSGQSYTGKQSLYMGYFKQEPMQSYLKQTMYGSRGSYSLSAYIKTHSSLSGSGAVLVLEAEDSQGKVIASSQSTPLSNSSGGWKKINVSLQAPYTTYRVTVKIGGVNCTGAFYVDKVSLLYSV